MGSRAGGHRRRVALAVCIAITTAAGAGSPAVASASRWERFGPPSPHALVPAGSVPEYGYARGRSVGAVAVVPPDRLVATTTDGGFVSTDAGASWRLTSAAANGSGATTSFIAVDPTDPSHLFAPSSQGLVASSDAGETWTTTSLQTLVVGMAIDPETPSRMLAVTPAGLVRTLDGGATWAGIPGAPSSPSSIAIGTASAIWLAAPGGVYRSADGGTSWMPRLGTAASLVAARAGDPDTVYAWTATGLQRSDDGGVQWTPLALPAAGIVQAIAFDPADASILHATLDTGGLLRSIDAGDTWSDLTPAVRLLYAPLQLGLTAVAAADPDTLYVGTTYAGIVRSVDGGATWTALGVDVGEVALVAANPVLGTLFVQNDFALYRSADGGTTWTTVDLAGVASMAFDPRDPERAYAGAGSVFCCDGVLRSFDDGATWTPSGAFGPQAVQGVAVDRQMPDHVYAVLAGYYGSSVEHSSDGGETWPDPVVFPVPELPPGGWSLAVHPRRAGVVYVGSAGGVWRSTDFAVHWGRVSSGLDDAVVTELAADAAGLLYAATRRLVPPFHGLPAQPGAPLTALRSDDDGVTWREIADGLPSRAVNAFTVDARAADTLYASTDGGVAITRTAGAHWEPTGLAYPTVATAIDPVRTSVLYAGTRGYGVFRIVAETCATAADCDDGDPCTTDTCDPASPLGDLDRCVHDRTDVHGISCTLEVMREAAPCADQVSPRFRRLVRRRLARATALVERAAARPRHGAGPLRRAARVLERTARRCERVAATSPAQECLLELVRSVRTVEARVRALAG